MIYGKISNGTLETIDADERPASIVKQYIAKGWKPVEEIPTNSLTCEEGYTMRVTPINNGRTIGFRFEKIADPYFYTSKISALKKTLSDSDYKVTKCYESLLVGDILPYDIKALHSERQKFRDEINALEAKLAALNGA